MRSTLRMDPSSPHTLYEAQPIALRPLPAASPVEAASTRQPSEPSETSELQKPQGRPSRRERYGSGPDRDWWWVTKIVLRSLSLSTAVAGSGLEIFDLTISSFELSTREIGLSAGILAIVIFIILWDTVEFITICARRGYGVKPGAHIGVELVLWLLCCLGAVGAYVQSPPRYYHWYSTSNSAYNGVKWALLGLFCSLLFLHFTLFVRAILDHKHGKGLTPRIAYLPTGQPVVVMDRPFPPPPSIQPPKRSSLSSSIPPPAPLPSFLPIDHSRNLSLPYVITDMPPDHSHTLPLSAPVPASGRPKRKPVPIRGTHYANPQAAPGPKYQPDEEERERATRGEAQAQWMTLAGMEVARIRRGDGPGEKFLNKGSEKQPRRNST